MQLSELLIVYFSSTRMERKNVQRLVFTKKFENENFFRGFKPSKAVFLILFFFLLSHVKMACHLKKFHMVALIDLSELANLPFILK